MNFFKCLAGTCKGTRIFTELLRQTVGRTIFHLFTMVILCSFFIGILTYSSMMNKVDESIKQLSDTLGPIEISKEGIKLGGVKESESLLFAGNMCRFNYLPSIEKVSLPDIDDDNIMWGIILCPRMILAWQKAGDDDFIIIPLTAFSESMKMFGARKLNRSEIIPFIKDNTSLKDKLITPIGDLSWIGIGNAFKKWLPVALFIGRSIGILWQVVLFVLIFSFILNISGKKPGNALLTFKERFAIGIYASFPPLIVASIFDALDLPFLSFNTIFVIGFSIYLIIVYTRLQLYFNPINE